MLGPVTPAGVNTELRGEKVWLPVPVESSKLSSRNRLDIRLLALASISKSSSVVPALCNGTDKEAWLLGSLLGWVGSLATPRHASTLDRLLVSEYEGDVRGLAGETLPVLKRLNVGWGERAPANARRRGSGDLSSNCERRHPVSGSACRGRPSPVRAMAGFSNPEIMIKKKFKEKKKNDHKLTRNGGLRKKEAASGLFWGC